VVNQEGRLVGHSTDWIGAKGGLRAILSDGGAAIAPEKLSSVLVMGAGAAGHSVIYALLQLGAERIMVYDEQIDVAHNAVAHFRELAEEKGTNLDAMDQVDAAFACDPSGLVNATPLGMIGNPGMAVTPAQLALLGPTAWVFDCVYVAHPKGCKSVLVRAAEERHLAAGHGAIMLLDKMMAQFELLTGLKPDAQHMGQTLGPCLEEVAGKVEPMTRQDLALGFPVGGNDGMANYAKLKEHWLMGSRNRSEPLQPPEDAEKCLKSLVCDTPYSKIVAPTPLRSVIGALGEKWINDKTL